MLIIFHFQSLQHDKNLVLSKNRLELLKHIDARMKDDGLLQTKYKLTKKIETELFTKLVVNLLYDDHVT